MHFAFIGFDRCLPGDDLWRGLRRGLRRRCRRGLRRGHGRFIGVCQFGDDDLVVDEGRRGRLGRLDHHQGGRLADTQDQKRRIVDAHAIVRVQHSEAADPLRPGVGVLLPKPGPVDRLALVREPIEPLRQRIARQHHPVAGLAGKLAPLQGRLGLPIAAGTAKGERIAGEVGFRRQREPREQFARADVEQAAIAHRDAATVKFVRGRFRGNVGGVIGVSIWVVGATRRQVALRQDFRPQERGVGAARLFQFGLLHPGQSLHVDRLGPRLALFQDPGVHSGVVMPSWRRGDGRTG